MVLGHVSSGIRPVGRHSIGTSGGAARRGGPEHRDGPPSPGRIGAGASLARTPAGWRCAPVHGSVRGRAGRPRATTGPTTSRSSPLPAPAPAPTPPRHPLRRPSRAAEPAAGRARRRPRAHPWIPALPQRPSAEDPEHATRLAVLIDARRIPEDVDGGPHDAARRPSGSVTSAAPWTPDWRRLRPRLDGVERLRRRGTALLPPVRRGRTRPWSRWRSTRSTSAREASVDEVVLAGDMTSMLPARLRPVDAAARARAGWSFGRPRGTARPRRTVRRATSSSTRSSSRAGPPVRPRRHRARAPRPHDSAARVLAVDDVRPSLTRCVS